MLEKKIGKITSSARRVSQEMMDTLWRAVSIRLPYSLSRRPLPRSPRGLRQLAATRPAFSGAPLVVLFVYISI